VELTDAGGATLADLNTQLTRQIGREDDRVNVQKLVRGLRRVERVMTRPGGDVRGDDE
jgi:hypothetical protein